MVEFKNPRSQVTRAALQAATVVFSQGHVGGGKAANSLKSIDSLVGLLLTKAADTNRFIRADATRVLQALVVNLSLHRALVTLESVGICHKSSPGRTAAADLVCQTLQAITPGAFIAIARSGLQGGASSRETEDGSASCNMETTNSVLRCASELLSDGNLDTRNSAKSIFRLLAQHNQFQSVVLDQCLAKLYRDKSEKLEQLKKAISQIK